MPRKSRWSLLPPVGGTILLVAGVVVGLRAPQAVLASTLLGVFGIIGIMVGIGAPLRRPGSPSGHHWRLIGFGVAAMVAAGVIVTLPPHSYVVGVLLLICGVGAWCVGVGMLGGGWFGIIGACASGLLASSLLMAPTPLALAKVGVPVQCHVAGSDGLDVRDFTAVCPGGHRYAFNSESLHDFPGGRVTVLVDPNGVFEAEYAGEHDPPEDVAVAVLSILVAAGVVVAAAMNRSRRKGRVAHVVKPPITT